MALSLRCGSALLKTRCLVRAPVLTQVQSASTARDEMKKYWETNLERKRPVSPFLSSYSLGLTGNMSLTHRITGVMMYVGLSGFGVTMLALPGNFPEYLNMVSSLQLGSLIIFGSKCVLSFPLIYHFLNGIRHLSWDTGRGFDLKTTYNTGYMVMALAAAVTLGIASL